MQERKPDFELDDELPGASATRPFEQTGLNFPKQVGEQLLEGYGLHQLLGRTQVDPDDEGPMIRETIKGLRLDMRIEGAEMDGLGYGPDDLRTQSDTLQVVALKASIARSRAGWMVETFKDITSFGGGIAGRRPRRRGLRDRLRRTAQEDSEE